ncbi:MAG TPA: hypothetical protein DD624_00110 [Alphaproteobacteria bacterium]|nr:hypothetical protein [Alphaproteobacteria bacterium]
MDLDVLTDDLTASAKERENQSNVALTPPAEKSVAAPKKESAKPVRKKSGKGKKAVKAVKAKKPKKAVKPVVKQPVKPAKKYEVKENGTGDAHDRLKPRADPVPTVKVLPVAPLPVKTQEPVLQAEAAPAEPMLSKHFLEQKEKGEQTAKELDLMKQAQTAEPDAIPEMLLTRKTSKVLKTDEAAKWSVVPVIRKLTPKERSAFLVKEVPADSATAKAVLRNKDLTAIFVFLENSAELTEEMQAEIEKLAKLFKKDSARRILILSYSRPSAQDTGRERQTSLRRALAVRSALARAGISSLRIEIRSQATKGAGGKLPDRADILIDG